MMETYCVSSVSQADSMREVRNGQLNNARKPCQVRLSRKIFVGYSSLAQADAVASKGDGAPPHSPMGRDEYLESRLDE